MNKALESNTIRKQYRQCQQKLEHSTGSFLTLIFANMTLNLSKSLGAALLFWTISFLPHELFSHLVFTSAKGKQKIN